MTHSILQLGTQNATPIHNSSETNAHAAPELRTLGDLLHILAENPPREFPMLRSTSSLLAAYLNKLPDEIPVGLVSDSRDGFRSYLKGRKNTENSIRTYINYVRILLKYSREFGWQPPAMAISQRWGAVLELSATKECTGLAKSLARIRKEPSDVTIEDLTNWALLKVQDNHSYQSARKQTLQFKRILRECGCMDLDPIGTMRRKSYGVPLEQFPAELRKEVFDLLTWKQVAFAVGRSKGARHRKVTSKNLQDLFCGLYGYAINVRGESNIDSLKQLVQKQLVTGYVEWRINVRKVKGYGLGCGLRLMSAAMRQHPSFTSTDFSWFKPLLDSIPIEPESELRRRKAEKFLEYEVLESIPAKIRAARSAAVKMGIRGVAILAMEELLMKWLTVLPWRQKNIRECRIGGPSPNLFKGKIPPFCDIDKPKWVAQEEEKNPEAEFWLFHFSPDETKTKKQVDAIIPRPLIRPLEEYLKEFRSNLIHGVDPGTLFVNRAGKSMVVVEMTDRVSAKTLRYGGRRVTPHLFRDIIAFKWLKEHPQDYLTLSKILWHSNINTTIRTYGRRFNESSGVCAMESWVEEREAKLK